MCNQVFGSTSTKALLDLIGPLLEDDEVEPKERLQRKTSGYRPSRTRWGPGGGHPSVSHGKSSGRPSHSNPSRLNLGA